MEEMAASASLEAFFECCPEMLFIAAPDGRLLCVSRALGEALGSAAKPGTRLAELVHPDDQAQLAATWARLRSEEAPALLAVHLRDARGDWLPLSLSARRSPEGDAIHGCLRQATPRPEGAEQGPAGALLPSDVAVPRLKERLLDALADQLPVVLWAIDREGTFLYHDGEVIEKIGLRRGQYVGSNIHELYAGQPGLDGMMGAFDGKRIHYTDITHGVFWENWIVPLRDERGEVSLVLGVTLDITEKKRVEDELRARLTQIEQQQEVIRALSTPIIEVWEGVLTLPMLGVIDSSRTAEVMDALLSRIVEAQARFAILDLTGIDMVDTGVAAHLIQLVSAVRLLGAEGIVVGIKPNVAQTMVTLGLDLSQITTHRNLRAALGDCLRRMGGSGSGSASLSAGASASASGKK